MRVDLGKFLLGAGEADLETLYLTEPAFALSFGAAGDEVVSDVDQPGALGRIWTEKRASDASFSELTETVSPASRACKASIHARLSERRHELPIPPVSHHLDSLTLEAQGQPTS